MDSISIFCSTTFSLCDDMSEDYLVTFRTKIYYREKDKDKKIMDLLVYFKYYLTDRDFKDMMRELQSMLLKLQSEVSTNAFDNVRGKMGIKNLDDLEKLKNLPKTKINHHKFDTY